MGTLWDKIRMYKGVVCTAAPGTTLAAWSALQDGSDSGIARAAVWTSGVALAIVGSLAYGRSKRIRYENLVAHIHHQGYDEHHFLAHMDSFWSRGVIKRVLRDTGNIDRYKSLRDRYKLEQVK